MKKRTLIVAIWLCTAVFALAQEAPNALKQHALTYFQNGDFEDAYVLLKQLSNDKPDDSEINFYLGRSALETKRYEEALAAFERVLIVEPSHLRSRLEIARIYFEEKRYVEAQDDFLALKQDDAVPLDVKKTISFYLDAIEKTKQKHFLSGFVSLGFGYDSNVNNGIGSKEYAIPVVTGLTLNGEVPKGDYFNADTFSLNHIYDMRETKEGLYWQDAFSSYLQNYRSEIQNNIRYISLASGPGFRTKTADTSIALSADKLVYGGLDYLYSFGISPKFSYKISDLLLFDASYAIKNKFYYYDNWNRNALYQEGSVDVKRFFPQSGSIVTLGYTASKEMERFNNNAASANGRTDVTNSSNGLFY